jgi:hypothetical protein
MRVLLVLMVLAVPSLALGQSCTTYGNVTNCLSGDPSADPAAGNDRTLGRRSARALPRDNARSFQPFGSPPVLSNRTSCIRYGSVVRCD